MIQVTAARATGSRGPAQFVRGRRAGPSAMAAACDAAGPSARAAPPPAVVSPEWLARRLEERPGSVRVLDASWYLPAMGRDAAGEFRAARIPGARFFDTDGIALVGTDLPHMLPPERAFAAAMDALGVAPPAAAAAAPSAAAPGLPAAPRGLPSHVVAYDGLGTFASPRLWWALRSMGHDRVSVLSGGLPAWRAAGLPVEEGWPGKGGEGGGGEGAPPIDGGAAAAARAAQEQQQPGQQQPEPPLYPAKLRPGAAWSLEQMLEATAAAAQAGGGGAGAAGGGGAAGRAPPPPPPPPQILDARPAARFAGAEPEPRAHLRRGHAPGALNVPFATLVEGGKDGGLSGARLKSPEALRAAFRQAGVDLPPSSAAGGGGAGASPGASRAAAVVCTCGSGLTACIVALALHEATGGVVDAAVYDGSWCEWGAREDTPIV